MLRECRIAAGIDIDTAILKLGIAERTLRGYEASDNAPEDIVDSMAELYQAPILRHWKCCKCVLGHIHSPVTKKELTKATLQLKNSIRGLEEDCIKIAVAVDDEIITEEEMSVLEPIFRKLETARNRITEFLINAKHGSVRQTESRVR